MNDWLVQQGIGSPQLGLVLGLLLELFQFLIIFDVEIPNQMITFFTCAFGSYPFSEALVSHH